MSLDHHVIHRTLSNGISLVLVPLANTEAVTVMIYMGVGSRYESDKQMGLAHFTEHMVFKGGDSYTTAQAVAQALDAVGGEFNAFTGHETTAFYTKTDSRHLELGLDVLSDMLLHAKFPESELAKEKGVIIEELNMYEDMPMRKVDEILSALLFGDTPLGRAIVGTKESVTSFTSEDFFNYRKQFYMGTQCTVTIAGSFDPDKAEELVTKYFAELPKGEGYAPTPGVLLREGSRVRLEHKKSEQTHFMLAVEALPGLDDRRYIQRLLTVILGGNMSSRLFVKVREEQGLCYYVRAYPDTYVDIGCVVANAGVDNNRLDKAVEAVLKEFREIRDDGVTDEELARAKQFLIGKTLLGMEDSEEVAQYYGVQDRLEGTRETPAEAIAKMEAVTKEEIHELAREIFTNDRLRLAVIGPHGDAEKLEGMLRI